MDRLSKAVAAAINTIEESVNIAGIELDSVRATWGERRDKVEEAYKKILRGLQKNKIDGDEFRRTNEKVRDLKAKKKKLKAKQASLEEAVLARVEVVSDWEKHKATSYRSLERTANRVSRKLKGIVKVEVTADGDRSTLTNHIRGLGGRMQELITALEDAPDIQLQELAHTARLGAKELRDRYGFTSMQARHLAEASEEFLLELEELTFVPTTNVHLNIAAAREPETWRSLDDLSTGQKATAVLMMLLLDAPGPLIIDQPEDDLDNRFIASDIIRRIREEKRKRQFIFSTHNANIPVLGDAELIIGLEAAGDAEEGQAVIRPEHLGSIDAPAIKKLVKDVLEGGDKAFRLRRERYGL